MALALNVSCATAGSSQPAAGGARDRCAMMSCPAGTQCVPTGVGGASCQPEPLEKR